MYDYENFEDNFEPSLYDQNLSEFYKKMKDALKDHVKVNIEYIENENDTLKEKISNLQKKNRDLQRKINVLEGERQNFLNEARRMRLSELMKDFEHIYYYADYEYIIGPKCEKCNDERRIAYTTPSGRNLSEACECSENEKKKYSPQMISCSSFDVRNGKFFAWYKKYNKKDEDCNAYSSSEVVDKKDIYSKEVNFDDMNNERPNLTKFIDIDDCQRYCDYLNSKQEFSKNDNLIPWEEYED